MIPGLREMLAVGSAAIVGLVFLVTGALKLVNPAQFADHLARLGVRPPAVKPGVVVAVAVECTVGAALVVGFRPACTLAAAAALLVTLSAVTLWSTGSGRTDSCGCYAGLATISPRQSVMLNAGYVALLGVSAWSAGAAGLSVSLTPLRSALVAAALIASVAGTSVALRHAARHDRPLLDLTRARPGRTWKRGWLGPDEAELPAGPMLVVFLSLTCATCHTWVKVLAAAHGLPGMPSIRGAVRGTPAEIAAFVAEHEVPFPILAVGPGVLPRLVDALPSAALVGPERVVVERWEKTIAPSFLDALRAALRERARTRPTA